MRRARTPTQPGRISDSARSLTLAQRAFEASRRYALALADPSTDMYTLAAVWADLEVAAYLLHRHINQRARPLN